MLYTLSMPEENMPTPETPVPGIEGLQFQKAEFEGPHCTYCQAPIGESFFQLAGQNICPACAEVWSTTGQRPSPRAVMKGFLYGAGAAIAGAVLTAVITLVTGFQIALVAIVVGYMVGKAFRIGTGGLGGRRCQILAVLLTYFAITVSHVPVLVKSIGQAAVKQKAADAKSPGKASEAEQPQRPLSLSGLLFTIVLITALALISPFLILMHGFSGILNLLIVFFGLSRAWQLTAADSRILVGPLNTSNA